MRRSAAPLPLLLLLATACGDAGDPAAAGQSPRPAPALQPFAARLKAMAAALSPPEPAEQRELRELGDLALQRVEADARTAARGERALLDHPAAWWVLEPALADEQVAVRRRAAWLCGQSAHGVLQLPLLLRLKYELDPETVLWVADALQRLGNDTGLAWLDAAIGAPATAEQAGAMAVAICRERGLPLSDPPTWDELRGHLQAQHAAWRQRGTSGRAGAPPVDAAALQARLAAHLATVEGTLLRPIDDAKYVLVRAGALGIPLLRQTLSASEPYLRTTALQLLAQLGPVAAAAGPDVLPLLDDALCAEEAMRTLGEIGTAAAIPRLRPALADPDVGRRAAAARALGLLRDEPSLPVLRRLLADDAAMDVRVHAAFAVLCLRADAEAEAFLAAREAAKDYHGDQLRLLRERLAAVPR